MINSRSATVSRRNFRVVDINRNIVPIDKPLRLSLGLVLVLVLVLVLMCLLSLGLMVDNIAASVTVVTALTGVVLAAGHGQRRDEQ
jgi:hypothetical protein